MVVRMLAMELYKAQQRVHQLRDEVEAARGLELDRLKRDLAVAEQECNQLRRRIDARKNL